LKKYIFVLPFLLILILTGSWSVKAIFRPKTEAFSVYQYSVPVDGRTAYLWIPPKADFVRGVIISSANMLENRWMNNSIIRQMASEEKLALLWIGGPQKASVLNADMNLGAGEKLEALMNQFAEQTGYTELAYAPFIPTGHSALGHLSWNLTSWNPERVIAAIAIKTIPFPDSLHYSGVPTLYMVGQTTEWPQFRNGQPGDRDFFWPVVQKSAINLRKQNKDNLIAVVTDPGGGHFDWSKKESRFMSLYIKKACAARLPKYYPAHGPIKLNSIKKESGWLTDNAGMKPDRSHPAPYNDYKGLKNEAYWFFDRELAEAAVAFCGDRKERAKQMVTFVQDGELLNITKLGFASLKFEPKFDGITFNLKGGFLKEVPAELVNAGAPSQHANSEIRFSVIDGPVIQNGSNTFQVHFNREGWRNDIWVLACNPGNDDVRKAVQPGKIIIPYPIKEGKLQTIHFPEIGEITSMEKMIKLNATSDAGLPVQYFVKSGPAFIEGNLLILTDIPEKAKFPMKITVVAWQCGKTSGEKIQSAEPVEQSFYITK